jgi:SAM-dependent methyltransferase
VGLFRVPPRRVGAREQLDEPGADPRAVGASLADLRAINRLLGYRAGVVADVWPLVLGAAAARGAATVLDCGAGSGDIALALARRAEREGVPVTVLALDNHPAVLAAARRHVAGAPAAPRRRVRLLLGDGLRLPLAGQSVDVALASLFLHHLDGDLAVALMAELARVARVGVVVSDLVRHPLALLGIRLLTRLGPFHPMTRHDGPLSVQRAYTEGELTALAAAAGLAEGGRLVRHPLWRMAWVWARPGDVPRHRGGRGFGQGERERRATAGG